MQFSIAHDVAVRAVFKLSLHVKLARLCRVMCQTPLAFGETVEVIVRVGH